jgi:hypothetical protein
MKSIRKKFKMVLVIIASLTMIVFICMILFKKSPVEMIPEILSPRNVLMVGKEQCTIGEALILINANEQLYEKIYTEKIWDFNFGEVTSREALLESTLLLLKQVKGTSAMAIKMELELNGEEISKIEAMANEYYLSFQTDLTDKLSITKEDVINIYTSYYRAYKIIETLKNPDIEISDDDARVMEIQQIVISKKITNDEGIETKLSEEDIKVKKAFANDVISKFEEDNFIILAEKYSDVREYERQIARNEFPDFSEVFKLENNEISGLIETDDAFYIIKCINSYDRQATKINKEIMLEEAAMQDVRRQYEIFILEERMQFNESLWQDIQKAELNIVETKGFFEIFEDYFE